MWVGGIMWGHAECAYGAGGGCSVISEKGWGWCLWGNVGAVCGVCVRRWAWSETRCGRG